VICVPVFHLLTVSDQTVWCVPVFHLLIVSDATVSYVSVLQLLTLWFHLNTSTILVQETLNIARSLNITQSLADGNLLNKTACLLRKRLAYLSISIRRHFQEKRNLNMQLFITEIMFYSKCECWMKYAATHRNKRQAMFQVHLLKFLMQQQRPAHCTGTKRFQVNFQTATQRHVQRWHSPEKYLQKGII
jgi:hypothetical protein